MTSYFVLNDFYRYDENIWEAKNFVTNEQCQQLIDYIKQADSSCDNHSHSKHLPENDPNADTFSWDRGCLAGTPKGEKGVFTNFDGIKGLVFAMEDAAARYTMQPMKLAKIVVHTYIPNSASPEHADIYPLATLLYLNDDYEGGELHFPKQDLSIRPDKGSLLCFKGSAGYTHEVKQIKGNNSRYVFVAFWEYQDEGDLEAFWSQEDETYKDHSENREAYEAEKVRLESLEGSNCHVHYPLTFPILEVKDFISQHEANQIREFLNINDISDNECWGAPCFKEYWAVQHNGEPVDLVYPEGINENTLSEINDRIRKVAEHFLDTTEISFSKYKGHDLPKGAMAPPHQHEPALVQADLMINDDYEGGESFFPSVNIQFKPNARSLYVYAEKEAFRHGVKEVMNGTRYHIASHWQPTWHEYSNAGANV